MNRYFKSGTQDDDPDVVPRSRRGRRGGMEVQSSEVRGQSLAEVQQIEAVRFSAVAQGTQAAILIATH